MLYEELDGHAVLILEDRLTQNIVVIKLIFLGVEEMSEYHVDCGNVKLH